MYRTKIVQVATRDTKVNMYTFVYFVPFVSFFL